MDEVTLRLLLAAAAPIGVCDVDAGERRVTEDHEMVGDDAPVLQREHIQRAYELVARQNERNREPRLPPPRDSGTSAREIVERTRRPGRACA